MNTLEFISENKFTGELDSLDELKSSFYKMGVRVSYDNAESPRRYIFSVAAKRDGIHANIVKECNGLILEAIDGKWRALVVPPENPMTNCRADDVNTQVCRKMFDIYEICDGTTISLYFDCDNWVMSTNKGIDVTNTVLDNIDYKTAFGQCLSIGMSVPEADFYNSLNKEYSYTFGFKHPVRHPFTEGGNVPIYRVWFIQKVHLTTYAISYSLSDENIEIAPQRRIPNPQNIHILFKKLARSYDEYVEYGKVLYGYLLRPKGQTKTGTSSILLTSRLMVALKSIYYNKSNDDNAKALNIPRTVYILVNTFLNSKLNAQFITLFPGFISEYNVLSSIITKLVVSVVAVHKNAVKLAQKNKSNFCGAECTEIKNKRYRTYATSIYNNMSEKMTVNTTSKTGIKAITEYILSGGYIKYISKLYIIQCRKKMKETASLS